MSYGQSLLKQYLSLILGPDLIEDARPDFLMGLELDIFVPRLRLAFEFQGDQHFVDTETTQGEALNPSGYGISC